MLENLDNTPSEPIAVSALEAYAACCSSSARVLHAQDHCLCDHDGQRLRVSCAQAQAARAEAACKEAQGNLAVSHALGNQLYTELQAARRQVRAASLSMQCQPILTSLAQEQARQY